MSPDAEEAEDKSPVDIDSYSKDKYFNWSEFDYVTQYLGYKDSIGYEHGEELRVENCCRALNQGGRDPCMKSPRMFLLGYSLIKYALQIKS